MTPDQQTQAIPKATPVVHIRPMFLCRADAASFLSISESMLDKLVAQGELAAPRRISAGRTGWRVEDLEAFGRSRPVSDIVPPRNAGYGRAGKSSTA